MLKSTHSPLQFYDVLLPFLTGRPLETSLVEAEQAAEQGRQADFGDYRSPQRSITAYVRCVFHAIHYMLRGRGCSSLQAKRLQLALRMQLVHMLRNDLKYMRPDDNGQRVCEMACAQLSYGAVKLAEMFDQQELLLLKGEEAEEAEKKESKEEEKEEEADKGDKASLGPDAPFSSLVLDQVREVVDAVREQLASCADKDREESLPARINLAGPADPAQEVAASAGAGTDAGADDKVEPALMQFRDMLAWDTEDNTPDPGQLVFLRKYVPLDMLQIPEKAHTRAHAVRAIRLADRLSTLMDNQKHCVKNSKFLIFALIQHVFTHVVPVPKPRWVSCVLFIEFQCFQR